MPVNLVDRLMYTYDFDWYLNHCLLKTKEAEGELRKTKEDLGKNTPEFVTNR